MPQDLQDLHDDELVRKAVRAATHLAELLREFGHLLDKAEQNSIRVCIAILEQSDFSKRDKVIKFSALHESVSVALLSEVLGVTTTLREVYSDAGCIEYEVVREPDLSQKGVELRRIDDALCLFRECQLELAIRDQQAEFLELRACH